MEKEKKREWVESQFRLFIPVSICRLSEIDCRIFGPISDKLSFAVASGRRPLIRGSRKFDVEKAGAKWATLAQSLSLPYMHVCTDAFDCPYYLSEQFELSVFQHEKLDLG
jgi:hypothetical protein